MVSRKDNITCLAKVLKYFETSRGTSNLTVSIA